jgi:hypothetical protein
MPFLQKIVDGFAYGIGLTVAWHIVGALLRFLASNVP